MKNQWIVQSTDNMSSTLCQNPEGWGPFSQLRNPDFTPCFEDSVIRLIPSMFIVFAGSIRLLMLSTRECLSEDKTKNWLYFTKMSTLIALLLLKVSTLLLTVREFHDIFHNAQLLSQVLNISVLVFVIFLHHLEYTRSKVGSGVLLFYWLFEIISSSVKLRTLILIHRDSNSHKGKLAIYAVMFALKAFIFVLENVPKPRSQYILLDEEDEMDCPEDSANIFSRITFQWVTPLMKRGFKAPLVMDDLWNLQPQNESENINQKFQKYWQAELKKEKPSLFRALVALIMRQIILGGICKGCTDMSQYIQPLLLGGLMSWVSSYLTDTPEPGYKGVFIAVGMLLTSVSQALFLNQYLQRSSEASLKMQAALTTAIYDKTIVLSNASRQQSTVGEIVNRMSVDAQRLKEFCQYFQNIWSGPFQMTIAMYLLWRTMGPSIWAGVSVLLLVIPINIFMAKTMRKYQNIQMRNKDTRVKLMNEILNGMKVLKLYAWEIPFINKINYIRNEQELVMLKKIGLLSASQSFTLTSTPFFVSIVTFTVYVLTSSTPLTSDIAFVAISLFGYLQFPMNMFPNVISAAIEAYVSLYRVQDYLLSEEIDAKSIRKEDYRTLPNWNPSIPLVEIEHADIRWDKASTVNVLSDINMAVKKGSLTAIVGRVGSGKSTLISSILGDNHRASGEITVRGSVAYVPQQPWIMNATLKENITFGLRFDPIFYEQVLEACSLKLDMQMLSYGDQTEIGERGINLSGGQKARISLARALYARADIYLFDDPLSAVDAHVGRHLFDNVLGPNGLLKNKARILVTHAIAYLSKVDEVIMLRDGRIASKGTYENLMAEEGELYKLVNDFTSHPQKNDNETILGDEIVGSPLEDNTFGVLEEQLITGSGSYEEESIINQNMERRYSVDRRFSTNSTISQATLRRASVASSIFRNHRQKRGEDTVKAGQLMTVEDSAKGKVAWSVYKQYAVACSLTGVIVIFALQICSQGAQVGSNVWLKHWSSMNLENGSNNHVWFYLGIYALIGWISTILSLIQTTIMWIYCAIRSSKFLHSSMLTSVIKSPMSFFDTTPLGRILNRFSKDQHTIDELLPRAFYMCIRVLIQAIAIVLVISASTPIFLVLIVPLILIYVATQKYYIASSRELKRLDSIARSPIYSHFQETIQGVSTIRAYDQQRVFIHKNQVKLDNNLKAFFPSITCNRWLSVRLDFISAFVIFGASLFAVFNVIYGKNVDPGLVGLSISYALSTAPALNMMIRSYSDIETNIVSVERVKEYIDLPQEKYESPKRVDPTWLSKGRIEFKGYSTRYREGLDLCLKELSFTIRPKEKIGIVGRTGAGKSSLSLALFRIIEAANGSIAIDGVDISSLRLFDLRSRLTIIPQDPVLFAGTVRENLDPFGTHEDAEIWQALQNSHLKEYVASMEGQLNGIVLEGGDNFSVGQRQLICLARALLRRTTVLILDEATAAIDVETDSIIQETIRRQFAECTILTIAHRINTVMDSDKILVLDKGSIIEFDSPHNLVENQKSVFYSLSKEAGLIE